MKRLLVPLSIVLLLASCAMTELSEGFSELNSLKIEPINTTESEQEPEPLSVEEFLAQEMEKARERYEMMEQIHMELDPSYEPVPFEVYWESLQSVQNESEPVVDEITPIPVEEAVELVLSQPETKIEEPVQVKVEQPSTIVNIGGNTLPMWFVYTASGLFLASLFSVCYIAKQRKESTWHRFRD